MVNRSIVDVLRNQLSPPGVPVLGGLPIRHGPPRFRLEPRALGIEPRSPNSYQGYNRAHRATVQSRCDLEPLPFKFLLSRSGDLSATISPSAPDSRR